MLHTAWLVLRDAEGVSIYPIRTRLVCIPHGWFSGMPKDVDFNFPIHSLDSTETSTSCFVVPSER